MWGKKSIEEGEVTVKQRKVQCPAGGEALPPSSLHPPPPPAPSALSRHTDLHRQIHTRDRLMHLQGLRSWSTVPGRVRRAGPRTGEAGRPPGAKSTLALESWSGWDTVPYPERRTAHLLRRCLRTVRNGALTALSWTALSPAELTQEPWRFGLCVTSSRNDNVC